MTKVNNGIDHVARLVGGDSNGFTGTASSAPNATTLTDSGASFPASSGGPPANGGLVGHAVVVGSVYGVVVSNTGTVLTVDFWHSATNPQSVGTTPSNGATYLVVPGGYPCFWMAVSVASRAIGAADAFLTNDGTTISEVAGTYNPWAGLSRAQATYSHTNGQATFQLQKQWTAGSEAASGLTLTRIGMFAHGTTAAPTTSTTGTMLAETAFTNNATVVQNDQLTATDTWTIS